MWSKLASNSLWTQRWLWTSSPPGLYFLNAGAIGLCHHAWFYKVPRVEPRDLCMWATTNWATATAQGSSFSKPFLLWIWAAHWPTTASSCAFESSVWKWESFLDASTGYQQTHRWVCPLTFPIFCLLLPLFWALIYPRLALEPLTLFILPPKCWNYRCVLPHTVFHLCFQRVVSSLKY